MAVSAEASRPNFNPDWMNVPKQNCPTFSSSSTCAANHIPPDLADNGYGGAIVGVSNDLATVVMAPPKLAKNRYSREEMLALFDSRMLAPDRLSRDFEDFFSATNLAQSPFCTLPLTTLEQQYLSLGGVNSNKALKDVIHAEHRLDPTVTAQPPVAVSLPGGPSSVPHHHQQQQQDSPSSGAGGGHQSRWASIGSNSGGGFGSIGGFGRGFSHDVHTPSGGSGGFGGGFRPRGGHSYGFGGVGRGRGFSFSGATQSRPFGGGGGGPPSEPVNRRAQGFYQATNSVNKERYPRQRLTSNSDHTSSGGGGVNEFAKSSQSGSVGGRWNNLTTETGSSTTTTGTSYHPPIQKGSLKLPEWATDDDDELDANNNDNHNNNNNNNNNNNDISHSSNNNKNNRKNVNDKDVVKEESRNNKNDQWSSVDSGGSFDADGNFVKGSVLPKPPPPIKYSDVDDKVKKVASSHISSSNANSTLLTSAQPRRVPQTFASVAGSRSTATKSIMNELAITSQTTQPFVQTNNTLTQSRASNNDQSFKHSSDPSTQVTISSISMPLSPAISSDLAAKILAIPNANPPISANRNVKITTESDLLRNLHKQAQNLVENVCVENSDNSLVKCQQQTVQSQQAGSFSSNNAQSLSDTWYYRDPQGTLQGPFASDMMAAWFKAGYFSMQLMIRNANDSNFATLGDWINRLGANPFMACQQLAINQQERIVSSQSQTVTAQSQSAIVNQLHAPNVATQSQVVGQQSRQVTPSCWNQQTTGSQDIYNYQPTSTVSATMTSACSWGIDAKGTNSSTSSIKTGHNAIYQQPIHSQNLDQNQVSTTKQQIQLDIGGTPAALNAQQIEQNLKQMLEQFKKAEQAKLEEQKKSLEADRKRLQELEEKILRETEEKTKKLQEAEDLLRKQRKETARIQEAQKREIEERRRLELETQEKLRLAEEKAAENLKRTKEEQGRRLLFERLKWETEVDAQQADQRKRNFEEQQRLVEEQGRQSEEAERLRLVRIQKEQEESESRRLEEQKRHILFDQLKSNSMAKENNYNQQQQQLHQVNHSTNFAPWAKNLGEKPSSNLAIGNSSDKAHNGSKTKNLMTNNLGQSLREIQLEEERQIAAERRQESEMELRKKALISSPVSNASGKFAWGGQGARNLTWDQALSAPLSSPPPPPSSLFTATNAKKSAPKGAVWTSLLTSNQINTTSSSDTTTMNSSVSVTSDGFWDEEPFDQHIQHVQQKKQQKPQKSASSAIVQKKSVKPATTGNLKNNSEQNVMKHYLASSSQSTDEFSLWCIKQVKRLNKNIEESEAAVFVEFLKNVPDVEVPDYVLGHVPDSKASSQFVNDFVERRQKWRQSSAGGLTSSNEWSIVSKHLPTQNQGNSVTEPKMTLKKSKTKTSQQKNKVVDSKILGFRPAGDPNRVNVGEIDMPM